MPKSVLTQNVTLVSHTQQAEKHGFNRVLVGRLTPKRASQFDLQLTRRETWRLHEPNVMAIGKVADSR